MMTIDEFLGSLPVVERSCTVKIGALELVFEAPAGYEDIVRLMQCGSEWELVCSKGFPKGNPLAEYACSGEVAREIGVMVHCLKSPNWEHLDLMKLAKLNGVVFSRIVNEFESWLKGYFAHDFADQIASEKKD